MLKDTMLKSVNLVHRTLVGISGGRIGGKLAGMPVLELETVGRKSGKRRTTMLTTPVHDDERLVLVASKGGDDRHPAWFLNLREHPDVKVKMGGDAKAMTARVATADEKAELWPRITEAYKGYGGYQDKTDRDIPVVILTDA